MHRSSVDLGTLARSMKCGKSKVNAEGVRMLMASIPPREIQANLWKPMKPMKHRNELQIHFFGIAKMIVNS